MSNGIFFDFKDLTGIAVGGCWRLAIGYWLLAIGGWLCVSVENTP